MRQKYYTTNAITSDKRSTKKTIMMGVDRVYHKFKVVAVFLSLYLEIFIMSLQISIMVPFLRKDITFRLHI